MEGKYWGNQGNGALWGIDFLMPTADGVMFGVSDGWTGKVLKLR